MQKHNTQQPPIKNQKSIIIGTIVVILAIFIIVPLIIFLINAPKTATLNSIIAPSFATMTIDGKTYPINKQINFKPTQTKAIITADGFQTQEINLDLKDHESTTIALYLTPNDGDLSYYYINQKEQQLFAKVTDTQASQEASSYREKYPITSILPISIVEVDPTTYILTEYRIDIGEFDSCKTDFCLKITDMTGGNHEVALNKIRENGFNPDDYEIIYEYTPYFTGAPARPTTD